MSHVVQDMSTNPEHTPTAYASPSSYLLPRMEGSRANFIRSSSRGPPDMRIGASKPNTFRANSSSSSFLTGSISISCTGNSGRPLITSNSFTASASCLGLSAVTSSTGKVCSVDLPMFPLPACCLLGFFAYAVPFTTQIRLVFESALPLQPHRRRVPHALNRCRSQSSSPRRPDRARGQNNLSAFQK